MCLEQGLLDKYSGMIYSGPRSLRTGETIVAVTVAPLSLRYISLSGVDQWYAYILTGTETHSPPAIMRKFTQDRALKDMAADIDAGDVGCKFATSRLGRWWCTGLVYEDKILRK